ncbi:hypothetical protein POM88_002538 [Heracleum sosnowskyi]|uniref:FBD domain-containing protein n=1 Tax=Heracleum sosnowskyi TaxID=360622 RepID=A0AAD8NCP9_9APIA|nr:hypothetical protein POM88_002538 [Heracleum sosnowskyi]
MEHVLSNRNHEIHVSCFKLFAVYPFPPSFLTRLIRYPNEHNVKEVDVDLEFHRYQPFKLSTFSSDTTQKLKLRAPLDFGDSLKLDCEWVLPVLKTLHLVCPPHISDYKLTVSCLMCLPALTTLRLDGVKLPESLSSMCLPVLTSLSVKRCKLPEEVWDFPNLLSLELDDVRLPENMDDFFSALVSVRDVTLYFTKRFKHDFTICCPQLVHLKIGTRLISSSFDREIMVVAPKLYEFCCMGIFKVILDVDELENASIKVWDTNQFNNATLRQKMLAYRPFINTLSKLKIANILTLDSAMIEGLSAVLVYLTRVPSPFKNLKHVKLPRGCEESSISTALRKYLLGGNPGATFVTALPQVAHTRACASLINSFTLQGRLFEDAIGSWNFLHILQ